MSLQAFAPAKINLSLCVGARLETGASVGRHPLDSLVVFTKTVGDHLVLEANSSGTVTLQVEGPFAPALGGAGDNLVVRAGEMLRAHTGKALGAHIVLHKHLPIASGIGGGSADAAAALLGLNHLWELGLETSALLELAARLGADVPACVLGQSLDTTLSSPATAGEVGPKGSEGASAGKNTPSVALRATAPPLAGEHKGSSATALHMTGTGEAIRALPPEQAAPLRGLGLVLVNPLQACATAQVFGAFAQQGQPRALQTLTPPDFTDQAGLLDYLANHPNDLQTAAITQVPAIAAILATLAQTGAPLVVRLSGSGATCFGLYPSLQAARDAAAILAQDKVTAGFWIQADEIA
jgi:4-diphosphocytidyl-2-C-methyl-D-erythritol kinase